MTPMPEKMATVRRLMRRTPRQNAGTNARASTTSDIRHHTSANAGSVINLPRMAVKPQITTHR